MQQRAALVIAVAVLARAVAESERAVAHRLSNHVIYARQPVAGIAHLKEVGLAELTSVCAVARQHGDVPVCVVLQKPHCLQIYNFYFIVTTHIHILYDMGYEIDASVACF